MTKIINSELLIKCKIWKNESLELVDFSNKDTEKTEIKVQSSGTLSRINKTITFTKGKNINKTPFELFTINHNEQNGYFYINCDKPPKELIKVLENNNTYIVYKRNKYQNIDNMLANYYELCQGDIIKLGRIYFKVLDINLDNKEDEQTKYITDINNNSKASIFRSSSYRSAMINRQEIINGMYSPSNKIKDNKTMRLIYSLKKNDNINIFAKMHKIKFLGKKENLPLINQKELFLKRNNSTTNDLFLNNKKINNNIKKNYFSLAKKDKIYNLYLPIQNEKDLNYNSENNNFNKKNKNIKIKACRICYGTDFSIENPLISPCICKGSMKYIHYQCLKNWLKSKIEIDLNINPEIEEEVGLTYCAKDLICELCKYKFPDYINHNGKIYNISFYKPKYKQFIILESIRNDKYKSKFIHILSFDNKNQISLGRSNDCDLSIPEISVSRFHCFIHKDNSKIFLEDNKSKFGTCILLQNPNILMIDNSPLRLLKGRTYIKLKLLINSNFFSCCNTNTFDSNIFSYQIQNQKYCDVASSFIIKKDNSDESDNKEENEENENDSIKNNENNNISKKLDNIKKIKNIKKVKIKENQNSIKGLININKKDNKVNYLGSNYISSTINGVKTTKNNNNLNLIHIIKSNDNNLDEKESKKELISNSDNNINNEKINRRNKENLIHINNIINNNKIEMNNSEKSNKSNNNLIENEN